METTNKAEQARNKILDIINEKITTRQVTWLNQRKNGHQEKALATSDEIKTLDTIKVEIQSAEIH